MGPVANNGIGTAQLFLAMMHDGGKGVAQDYAVAVKWYRLQRGGGQMLFMQGIWKMVMQHIISLIAYMDRDAARRKMWEKSWKHS